MIPLTWSDWIDLDADLATYRQHVAATAGFYRIREKQQESLAYIGRRSTPSLHTYATWLSYLSCTASGDLTDGLRATRKPLLPRNDGRDLSRIADRQSPA